MWICVQIQTQCQLNFSKSHLHLGLLFRSDQFGDNSGKDLSCLPDLALISTVPTFPISVSIRSASWKDSRGCFFCKSELSSFSNVLVALGDYVVVESEQNKIHNLRVERSRYFFLLRKCLHLANYRPNKSISILSLIWDLVKTLYWRSR